MENKIHKIFFLVLISLSLPTQASFWENTKDFTKKTLNNKYVQKIGTKINLSIHAPFWEDTKNFVKKAWNNKHVKNLGFITGATSFFHFLQRDRSKEKSAIFATSLLTNTYSNQIAHQTSKLLHPNSPNAQNKTKSQLIGAINTFNILGFGYTIGSELKKVLSNKDDKDLYERIEPDKIEIGFNQIGGCNDAKKEITNNILLKENPAVCTEFKVGKADGILLYGEPGNGKTLFAKAVAKKQNKPLYYLSGSNLVKVYVGNGSARARMLFDNANQEKNGCVLFIDEIDSIAGKREELKGTNEEKHDTINQLLQLINKLDEKVTLITATNKKPDNLDAALTRPGRIGTHIKIPAPDEDTRRIIFELNKSKHYKVSDKVTENFTRDLIGASGAEIAAIAKEANKKAALRKIEGKNNPYVTYPDLIHGLQKQEKFANHRRVQIEEINKQIKTLDKQIRNTWKSIKNTEFIPNLLTIAVATSRIHYYKEEEMKKIKKNIKNKEKEIKKIKENIKISPPDFTIKNMYNFNDKLKRAMEDQNKNGADIKTLVFKSLLKLYKGILLTDPQKEFKLKNTDNITKIINEKYLNKKDSLLRTVLENNFIEEIKPKNNNKKEKIFKQPHIQNQNLIQEKILKQPFIKNKKRRKKQQKKKNNYLNRHPNVNNNMFFMKPNKNNNNYYEPLNSKIIKE